MSIFIGVRGNPVRRVSSRSFKAVLNSKPGNDVTPAFEKPKTSSISDSDLVNQVQESSWERMQREAEEANAKYFADGGK